MSLASFLQRGEVAGVKRKCVFEGPVAQDVTTPPVANEGDMSVEPGQPHTYTCTHTYTIWHSRNAAAVTKVQAVMKALKYSCGFCASVCVSVKWHYSGSWGGLRGGRGLCWLQWPTDRHRWRGSSHIIDLSEKRKSESEEMYTFGGSLQYFRTWHIWLRHCWRRLFFPVARPEEGDIRCDLR